MWPRFGIKVGNSTLCIAVAKEDGKVEVIANKQGDRVSQACLLWDGANEIECGLTAQQKMATRPKQGVAKSFQLLLPEEDLTEQTVLDAMKEVPCEFDAADRIFRLRCNDNGDEPTSRTLTAADVHAHLLRSELELARQFHTDITKKPVAVLSIPSYYPKASWSLLETATAEAGFHVAQIITEPAAAILAHSIGEEISSTSNNLKSDGKYVLTIKSGGLFSHFALYTVTNGVYIPLAAFGPFPIGGRQYTDALVQFICTEFQRKYKLDPHESRRSLAKIHAAAANCKHILTTLQSTQLYIDSLMDGVDFNAQMSRARFESLIQPVINGFLQTLDECVQRAFKEHACTAEHIDHVVLLGATTSIPKLQAAIAARFPEAQLHTSLPTDEVVAIGCARQSTFVVNVHEQSLEALDECMCSEEELRIWHGTDEANAIVLLPKGTILPTTVRKNVNHDPLAESSNQDETNVFHLRAGAGDVSSVKLINAKRPNGGKYYSIEAKFDLHETDSKPFIRLRCM